MEYYITDVKIRELRHLSDIDIELNRKKRTNLLLTGKNGSGKTSVLYAIKEYLRLIDSGQLKALKEWYQTVRSRQEELHREDPAAHEIFIFDQGSNILARIEHSENNKYAAQSRLMKYYEILKEYKRGIHIDLNEEDGICDLFEEGRFITAFYGADRKAGIEKVDGVDDVILKRKYLLDDNPGDVLLKYLVHLKTQQAYARNEGDQNTLRMIDEWFERFVKALKVLLDDQSIELKYDYKTYNFEIIEKGRNPFGFDQLSDGYSAAIRIVADLILRMEQNWLKGGELSSYDTEGIVLIDELETHLHISLQRTILPFLTEFFPKIQFIVSTHSPYILNSIEDCVIYDLEKNIRMENMSGYSAEGIAEGYFEADAYSELLMKKVKRYEDLVSIEDPTDHERAERAQIKSELKQLSGDLSKEAKSAFDDIEQRRKQHDQIYP